MADWQQEDSLGSSNDGESENEKSKETFYDFALPFEEYHQLAFDRRLEPEGSSSPPSLSHQLSNMFAEGGRSAKQHTTVEDTDGDYTHFFGRSFWLKNIS